MIDQSVRILPLGGFVSLTFVLNNMPYVSFVADTIVPYPLRNYGFTISKMNCDINRYNTASSQFGWFAHFSLFCFCFVNIIHQAYFFFGEGGNHSFCLINLNDFLMLQVVK